MRAANDKSGAIGDRDEPRYRSFDTLYGGEHVSLAEYMEVTVSAALICNVMFCVRPPCLIV
jgi:hypothetical protein